MERRSEKIEDLSMLKIKNRVKLRRKSYLKLVSIGIQRPVKIEILKSCLRIECFRHTNRKQMRRCLQQTTSGVANWDPLLGGKKTKIYTRKRRKIDGRSKDYKETVHRVQARRDAQDQLVS